MINYVHEYMCIFAVMDPVALESPFFIPSPDV